MKRVDENYSYDELEGFAPLELNQKARKDDIWISAHKNTLGLSSAARKILLVKTHLRIAYNRERKQLLLQAASDTDKGVIPLPPTASHNLHCAALTKLLEKECRYDLSIVRIHVYGEVSHTRKGAVIFNLNTVVSKKTGEKEKK